MLVHGGMAQNVGPILEMVTEKYLLRSEAEWAGRQEAMRILDAGRSRRCEAGDIRRVGAATTRQLLRPDPGDHPVGEQPLHRDADRQVARALRRAILGLLDAGRHVRRRHGLHLRPRARKAEAQEFLQATMSATKRETGSSAAVRDGAGGLRLRRSTSTARRPNCCTGDDALLSARLLRAPRAGLLRGDPRRLAPLASARELERVRRGLPRRRPEMRGMVRDAVRPAAAARTADERPRQRSSSALLDGERLRPASSTSRSASDLRARPDRPGPEPAARQHADRGRPAGRRRPTRRAGTAGHGARAAGDGASRGGAVAVVTLAAGAGSRWTQGAGVVKALHPFCEARRAATAPSSRSTWPRAAASRAGVRHRRPARHHHELPDARADRRLAALRTRSGYGYAGPVHALAGPAVGLRMVPMVRDLRFAWEEMPQQMLDEQAAEGPREPARRADRLGASAPARAATTPTTCPLQCLHPVGHWYEVPNLLRNGVLRRLLAERPQLQVPDGAQHRHARRGRRPGAARLHICSPAPASPSR